MKKKYETVDLSVIVFNNIDILTTSGEEKLSIFQYEDGENSVGFDDF